MIIVVMGVCGSGKTTVGTLLAEKMGCSFADADQFHSEPNKTKMANGQPLTDQDRLPWLQSIHDFIISKNKHGKSVVVTCSALKHFYRDVLQNGQEVHSLVGKDDNVIDKSADNIIYTSQATEKDVMGNNSAKIVFEAEYKNENHLIPYLKEDHSNSNGMVPVFIHLTGSPQVLEDRLSCRKGHFMPKSLLKSQLDTLEELCQDEVGFSVNIDQSTDDIVNEILTKIGI